MTGSKWRIVVGSDDAGLAYKEAIKSDLAADERVSTVADVGMTVDGPVAAYPSVAFAAASLISSGTVDRAILVCGTGIGMAISANKVGGVRATTAHDSYSVERSILSNDCQVLAIGQRVIGLELARRLVREWLGYRFDAGSASAGKVALITSWEAVTR